MAKCKYPNEVCTNMTILNGEAYCDSVPCSLKDELPKQTNADHIRSMSDEELAEFMANKGGYIACSQCDFFNRDKEKCESPSGWLCTKGYAEALIHKWLRSEVE